MFQIKSRNIKINNFLTKNNTIIYHNNHKIICLLKTKKIKKINTLKYHFILSFNFLSLINSLPIFNSFFENKILTFSTLFFGFSTFYLFYKLNNFKIDYSKLDYNLIDYSKLDYNLINYLKLNYSKLDYSKLDYNLIDYLKLNYSKLDYNLIDYSKLNSNLIDYSKFLKLFSHFDIKAVLTQKKDFYLFYKKLIKILKEDLFTTDTWFDLNFRAYENSLEPEGLIRFQNYSEKQKNYNVLEEAKLHQKELLTELDLNFEFLTLKETLINQKSNKILESLTFYDQGILLKNSDQILQLLENLSL